MTTLAASRCGACALSWVPPRGWCPACGRDVEPASTPAAGFIVSWTRVEAPPAGHAPGYVLALVDLADGTRVLARADADAPEPAHGARVRVRVDGAGRATWSPSP